eukprot:PITA_15703
MKVIPLQHIPTFHGLTSEDPDAFLFEFDVMCRGYDYNTDPQKLKLFPSTLKGATLRWFMGLGGGVINNWDQMKERFLKKYQDYCRSKELKDEIFQMVARPNETLEEYVEHFQYNLQRSPYASLPLPDNTKQKQAEAEQNFAIFYPRCRKKHNHKECPLDAVQVCAICMKDHSTESCPSLPRLKAVYKEAEEDPEPVYLLNQRRQWQPRQSALQQNPQSNLRPQLPAQPNPNLNNGPVQSIQIIETPEIGTDLRECNDLQLRFGRIIETEGDKTAQVENQLPIEQPPQEEDVIRQQIHDQATTPSPPFPERLIIPRPIQHPDFDILGELKNLYIKIPLLQASQDIQIYAKTIKELCIKKPRRTITNNPTVQLVSTLSDLLLGKETPVKYEDPRNPIVTVPINGQTFSNALVDLGAAINILTTTTCQKLGITSVEPTSTLLELVDRFMGRPEGTLHDVMVAVDSWEYHTNFLIINPKN